MRKRARQLQDWADGLSDKLTSAELKGLSDLAMTLYNEAPELKTWHSDFSAAHMDKWLEAELEHEARYAASRQRVREQQAEERRWIQAQRRAEEMLGMARGR